MLQVSLPVVAIIHTQSNKFVTGAKIKETAHLKLIDSPIMFIIMEVIIKCFKYAANWVINKHVYTLTYE